MATGFGFSAETFLEHVDEIIRRWSKCSVPLFIEHVTESGRRNNSLDSLGSGFFVCHRGHTFLVTAAHVLDGLDPNRELVMSVNGVGVPLNGIPFRGYREKDLAFALLDSATLNKHGVQSVNYVPMEAEDESCYLPILWIAIGYPGSRNGLNPRVGKNNINIYGASFYEKLEKPSALANIRNPIGYKFDKKAAVNTKGKSTNPLSFQGTSGGPILEVIARIDEAGGYTWCCRLDGILLGWYNKEKEVIAARANDLKDLLDNYVDYIDENIKKLLKETV